ncbi:Tim44/TimA family putative adaptor protein [Rhodobacteraceae bacterium RKSG542]|uniref:Tim44/TimA family putative adaptor protein n=1 Tax=Pseudovibrio flavus TaxID=2529854 RepID=UPI0012BD1F3C|nr:Tim44/TimA family putative adaptor protein [Pseudovibrio flavus]MTI18511.1 Tim44/TimA family putative adaptor protein [Pseudovibrio flavus]
MSEIFDVTNIIFLVAAVFIFLRLRSVLGKRTGNERPPYDPYSARGEKKEPEKRANGNGDNVIPLPGNEKTGNARVYDESRDEIEAAINQVAPAGSPSNEKLHEILKFEPNFNPKEFIKGAGAAYEMIITAFAHGDRKTLKGLLSDEVFDGFVGAINERESRKETVDSTFIGIDKAAISDVDLTGNVAQITVRLKAQLISATKDEEGHIVDGDPTQVSEVTDIWTFSRELGSNNPNWKLVATESAE